MAQITSACEACEGSGSADGESCPRCNGTGHEPMARANKKPLYIS